MLVEDHVWERGYEATFADFSNGEAMGDFRDHLSELGWVKLLRRPSAYPNSTHFVDSAGCDINKEPHTKTFMRRITHRHAWAEKHW